MANHGYMRRNFLSSKERELYDQIYLLLKDIKCGTIYTELRDGKLSEVAEALHFDYPEYTFAWKKDRAITNCKSKKGCMIKIEYCYEREKIIKIRTEIDKYIQNNIAPYIKAVGCSSQLDIVLAVYNYLSKVLTYSKQKGASAYTLETLYHLEGVCRGISLSLVYILRLYGIECFYIRGRIAVNPSEANLGRPTHGWCMVKLDGNYYHLDLTWDLNASLFDYFLLKDSEIYQNHHRWDFEQYPKAI